MQITIIEPERQITMGKKSIHAAALTQAFEFAWLRFLSENTPESIRHVNESVFRYFMVSALRELLGPGVCEDEWKRIDLMLRAEGEQSAVELKFYDSRPFRHLNSETVHHKGKPSKGNKNEFAKSLDGLMNLQDKDNKWYHNEGANITERFFVLVGVDRNEKPSLCFSDYYLPANLKSKVGYQFEFLAEREKRLNEPENDLFVFGWLARVTA